MLPFPEHDADAEPASAVPLTEPDVDMGFGHSPPVDRRGQTARIVVVMWIVFLIVLFPVMLTWHDASWAKWNVEYGITGWVQAVGSIGAILIAAWVVKWQHELQVKREKHARIVSKIELCNGALLISWRQFNWLKNVNDQFLDQYRDDPARHVNMPPMPVQDVAPWAIENRDLAFLIATPAKEAVMDWILSDALFQAAAASINDRSFFHRTQYQPRAEKAGFDGSLGMTMADFEKSIGPLIVQSLRRSTDAIYVEVHRALEILAKVGIDMPSVLRQQFPGARFIGFALPVSIYTGHTAPTVA